MVKKTKGIPLKDARPQQKKGVHRREPLWILVVCLWYTPIFNLNDRGNAKVGKKEKGLTRSPKGGIEKWELCRCTEAAQALIGERC
mgnify:CR=1 FL=1